MLPRAAQRQFQKDAFTRFRFVHRQLSLPWLHTPLFSSRRFVHGSSTTSPFVNGAASLDRDAHLRLTRHLATARADQYEPAKSSDLFSTGYSPSPSPSSSSSAHEWSADGRLSDIRHFNVSSNIIIHDMTTQRPTYFKSQDGIFGTAQEIAETLQACLDVGRFKRATALIQRLERICGSDAPEIVDFHNTITEKMAYRAMTSRKADDFEQLQAWFELGMRSRGIKPTATIYALIIKTSLHVLHGPRQERTVRRYFELARQDWLQEECLNLPILSDSELGRVTAICKYAVEKDFADISFANSIMGSETALDANGDAAPAQAETAEPDPLPSDASKSAMPTVFPTSQKGQGLKTLKGSLSTLITSPSDDATLDKYDRQIKLEKNVVETCLNRWRLEYEEMNKREVHSSLGMKSAKELMWEWTISLTHRIEEEKKLVLESEDNPTKSDIDITRCGYGPFLFLMPAQRLAGITIITVLNHFLSGDNGGSRVKLANMLTRIGTVVEEEDIVRQARKLNHKGLKRFVKGDHLKPRKVILLLKHALIVHAEEARKKEAEGSTPQTGEGSTPETGEGPTPETSEGSNPETVEESTPETVEESTPKTVEEINDGVWSTSTRTRIGAALMSMLTEEAKITVTREDPLKRTKVSQIESAFSHSYAMFKGKRVGVMCLHDDIHKLLISEPPPGLLAKHLPMVATPKAWRGFREGGMLLQPISFIRSNTKDKVQLRYGKVAAERGDLEQIFAAMDVLGKTGWKINRGVFRVMVNAWNSGKEWANIAPLEPDLEYPPEPEDTNDINVYRTWKRHVYAIDNERIGLHSKRCFQNLQLEVARAYLNETFYMPHNIDFRGRAYPIPPYLNHMGADNARGLLVFAKGKELGQKGLRWIKIHLSNVWGYDKASLNEREKFASDHLDDIYDSVDNPFNGRKWWLTAEAPWQCLAACMELKEALASPDPTKFMSHLPIAQDGSCNGLQHYAALGGDPMGAQQVNLEPGDKPADVYSGVADLVRQEIETEADEGDELAKYLADKITRKVVKQTVMTNVYGVTFMGARAQVRRQLQDLYPNFPDTETVSYRKASSYISFKIFKALSTMFTGAHQIQFWLGECANRITSSLTPAQINELCYGESSSQPSNKLLRGSRKSHSRIKDEIARNFQTPVIWTTPLRLPVVQPYRSPVPRRIPAKVQNQVSVYEYYSTDPVSKRKQVQAFPPNFVHSLDATHMALSALKCNELGLTFAAVHDSFWTHPSDVDVMNSTLRDAFVRMHSENIIGRLADEFRIRYKGNMYLARLHGNTDVAKKITKYRKQMADVDGKMSQEARKIFELGVETERVRLLRSRDPEERVKGRAMVTAASILAAEGHDEDYDQPHSIRPVTLGAVSRKEVEAVPENENEEGDNVDITRQLFGDDNDEVEVEDHEVKVSGVKSEEVQAEAEHLEGKPAPKKPKRYPIKKVWVWLPLTFPPIPKKGNFDVSRLKKSQYFFS